MKEVISLQEAKKRGLKRYFTGRPCKYGHVTDRIVSNARCYACLREWAAKEAREHPERVRDRWRASYKRTRPNRLESIRRWQGKNPAKMQALEAERNRRDPFRSHQKGGI